MGRRSSRRGPENQTTKRKRRGLIAQRSPRPTTLIAGASPLRLFGARIRRHVKVRPTVRIETPWHLKLRDRTAVGDCVVLQSNVSLARITTGRYVTVSQYAHLCAGTHERRTQRMTLLVSPITLGDDA